jgi:uncharacterized protein YjiK
MKKVLYVVIVMMIIGVPMLFWKDLKQSFAAEGSSFKGTDAGTVEVVDKWELPEILKEVSGIEYLGNNQFACIQDELGTIFIYNTAAGKIEKEIPFAGPGDYEGIAIAGSTAYVVQSDGKIYEVTEYQSAKPAVKEYTTPLTAKHNVEGLTYDRNNNRLLLAIKGEESENVDYKGVYAFDLKAKQLASSPVIKINLYDPVFNGAKGKKKSKVFQPSEIEIHPQTNEIYILQGTDPKLLVMDAQGQPKKMHSLQSSVFPQAEGLAFTPQGDLYISNEGKKGAATIVKVAL